MEVLSFFALFVKKVRLHCLYNTSIVRKNSGFKKGVLIGDIRFFGGGEVDRE